MLRNQLLHSHFDETESKRNGPESTGVDWLESESVIWRQSGSDPRRRWKLSRQLPVANRNLTDRRLVPLSISKRDKQPDELIVALNEADYWLQSSWIDGSLELFYISATLSPANDQFLFEDPITSLELPVLIM